MSINAEDETNYKNMNRGRLLMRRVSGWQLILFSAGILLGSTIARAQARGHWSLANGDPSHDKWQITETKISSTTVRSSFKLLWKIKLGNEASQSLSYGEPLFIPSVISSRGFKDVVLWSDANSLYAVDYGLGTILWKKTFKVNAIRPTGTCRRSNLPIALEFQHVAHSGVNLPPGTKTASPLLSPPSSAQRWIGAPTKGGGFALKGVYILTPDGYLHEQVLTTGQDYAPAVKFISAPVGNLLGMNVNDKILYTESRRGCGAISSNVWSIDLNTPEHPIQNYPLNKVSLTDSIGPAIGSDGTVYISTGEGLSGLAAEVHAHSVVALTANGLKVSDWYSPLGNAGEGMLRASPIVIDYKNKDLLVASGGDGSIVLLDSRSLGGEDHHTPLAQTNKIVNAAKGERVQGFASWRSQDGGLWVLASILGPIERNPKFNFANGNTPHGSIVAFRVEEMNGKPVLTPEWVSRDLMSPAPPAIANGIVFALAKGDASNHAILYALDAITGKELYSSGDAINAYTQSSGVSIGDGHVFLTTHDNTLYSFGIPMEH